MILYPRYIVLSKRRHTLRRRHRRNRRSRRSVRNTTSNYDLSQPQQTQSMFETRLSRASSSKPINPVQQSDDLDESFQTIWSSLETSLKLTQEIQSVL